MDKLLKASLLLVILAVLNTKAFAAVTTCDITSRAITDVKTVHLAEDAVIINGSLEIPLEKTKIRCGVLGKRARYEGAENGFQVILKDCTADDSLQGAIIDAVKQESMDINCR